MSERKAPKKIIVKLLPVLAVFQSNANYVISAMGEVFCQVNGIASDGILTVLNQIDQASDERCLSR